MPGKVGVLLVGLIFAIVVGGCAKPVSPLRIGTNIWPGYEFLYVARAHNHFDESQVHLVEYLSATEVMQSLHAGNLDAAALTLDEAISLSSKGLSLSVVAVLDISDGGDAVMVKPHIQSVDDLHGATIALEKTALGVVMLQGLLEFTGLSPQSVNTIQSSVDRHIEIFDEVDAVITFEPVVSQLASKGAKVLFDSSQIPGKIVDVLVVRQDMLDKKAAHIQRAVNGHFLAYRQFVENPQALITLISTRQNSSPSEALNSYSGLKIPDPNESKQLFESGQLQATADALYSLLKRENLIDVKSTIDIHFDGRFVNVAN